MFATGGSGHAYKVLSVSGVQIDTDNRRVVSARHWPLGGGCHRKQTRGSATRQIRGG
jgi:hypothetical protein